MIYNQSCAIFPFTDPYADSQIIETLDGSTTIWYRKPTVLHKKPHQVGWTFWRPHCSGSKIWGNGNLYEHICLIL